MSSMRKWKMHTDSQYNPRILYETIAGMIRRLEEVTLEAWPALQTMHCDGWLVRFAGGFSRRSNSVNPLYPSCRNVVEKIRVCEALYRERGLKTVFKITAASEPRELDGILASDGYRTEAETGVQILSLGAWGGMPAKDVALQNAPTEDWLSAVCALNAYDPRHHGTFRSLAALIHPPVQFASIRSGGRIVACGLGVIRRSHLCLFDIVVDADFRRRGYGRQTVAGLLIWGREQTADTAVLQVMADNPIAQALYAGFGFREVYRYMYRVKQ
jgi:GNAT superfamily N-acetyltransferase